jgi:hypothetical protein
MLDIIDHGDPTILSIEILQVDDKAYYSGTMWSQGTTLRTMKRLSFGIRKSKFDVEYSSDRWGEDRFWEAIQFFDQNSATPRSTERSIKQASVSPNFCPKALYRSQITSTDIQLNLTYTMDVETNRNYSIWLHSTEIVSSVTDVGI